MPTAKSFSITSAAGVPFTLFGKNKEWNSFLYERLVAPTLGSGAQSFPVWWAVFADAACHGRSDCGDVDKGRH